MIPVALRAAAVALALAGCVGIQAPASPIPGTIGAAVHAQGGRVVIGEVDEAARQAGLREGDVVLAYNGEAVRRARQFERLVLDSRPGSVASVEVLRGEQRLVIRVDVREIDTAPTA